MFREVNEGSEGRYVGRGREELEINRGKNRNRWGGGERGEIERRECA